MQLLNMMSNSFATTTTKTKETVQWPANLARCNNTFCFVSNFDHVCQLKHARGTVKRLL